MSSSFYWHDYETWGSDPRRDRPAQFAGQRTNADLTPIGPPLVVYCRPADDCLPDPDACLITGITPQRAQAEGVIEAELAAIVERELAQPGTCGAGYNSFRFDDEVTRHLLYRNLIDPYAREWRHGNSRWDLIDPLRLAHALRPDGIIWPRREDGATSFRLEDLSVANGIEHGAAHDAFADVQATISLARLLRDRQPRLFAYALVLRDRHRVRQMLAQGRPLLHVSARYPAELGCVAPVLPVAPHPTNANGVLVFDLRHDPAVLLDLTSEQIREQLFTPSVARPPGAAPIPIKTVRCNHAPILAPLTTLTPDAADRWAIDLSSVRQHARILSKSQASLRERLSRVFDRAQELPPVDPDLALYAGGFLSDADRRELDRLRRLTPTALAHHQPQFEDGRLPEMLWRYRARNWPESLSQREREEWDAFRLARLTDPESGCRLTLDAFERRLSELAAGCALEPEKRAILEALRAWAGELVGARTG